MAGDPGGVQLTASGQRPGTWIVRGERTIYHSDWVGLSLVDVVMPDGTAVDHHVVRMPRQAAGTIIVRSGRVLLLHRHRFITDTWGWEIPAGAVDAGETVEAAAAREAIEESGFEPLSLAPLCVFHPSNGVMDQTFHIFVASGAADRGGPTDHNEASAIEWVPIEDVRQLLRSGEISDGLSFGAIAYWLATRRADDGAFNETVPAAPDSSR